MDGGAPGVEARTGVPRDEVFSLYVVLFLFCVREREMFCCSIHSLSLLLLEVVGKIDTQIDRHIEGEKETEGEKEKVREER